jgi:hypothetical protein
VLGQFTPGGRYEDKNVKPLNLDRRSKITYGIAATFFLCAIGFCVAGLTGIGGLIGTIGVSLAIGNAWRQRRLLGTKDGTKAGDI